MHEDSEIRRLFGEGANRAVVESMPGLLAAARDFAGRTWDLEAEPPDDPLEKRFGPVRLVVSRRWMPQPPDPRRMAWLIDERAMLAFQAMAGAHHTPSLADYVDQRGAVTHDGYYRFGAAPLPHATGLEAWEVGETAPHLADRPVRYLRLLRGRRAILVLSIEAAGHVPSSVGAPFAAAFQSLRLD